MSIVSSFLYSFLQVLYCEFIAGEAMQHENAALLADKEVTVKPTENDEEMKPIEPGRIPPISPLKFVRC
jgi:hypothetical protein